jgi:hypothetical protein
MRSVVTRDAQQRVPETVRQAIKEVCRSAFHWKGDVRSIFLDAGVPEEIYDRYDIEENSKARIARLVLNDLRQLVSHGAFIERKIDLDHCPPEVVVRVLELANGRMVFCRSTHPHDRWSSLLDNGTAVRSRDVPATAKDRLL